ncbi:hypothetical protein FLONG3_3464 [Fusarium longipes]|uniref:Azaphilone pigments biosynthesis cluster protein L N-terminal domain-containing protein n=1 Tax=Fusarium longipes TaxID=694270 RepID=A0A395T0U4_9HYPO|nr:hypothetical protein FLONG3_3464 [Fusarium longipes]
MSDPLSVAGTAVGITSLGIQVCQGLIKYLRAVRGRKEEIREGVREVEQVVSLLYCLNNVLPNFGPRSGTTSLRECLKNCYAELEGLRKLLDKLCNSHQPDTNIRRTANVLRSISYPFRQEELNEARQSLRSVLSDLQLVISITSLDSSTSIHDTVNDLSQDIKALVTTNDGHLTDLRTKTYHNSVQLQSLQTAISDTLNEIKEQLHSTQLSIQDLDHRVDGKLTIIETGTRSIEANSRMTAAKMEEVIQAVAAQSALISSLGLQINGVQNHEDICAITTDHSRDVPVPPYDVSIVRKSGVVSRRGCQCQSTVPKSRTFLQFWNLKNVVRREDSPFYKLLEPFYGMKVDAYTSRQLIRKLKSLENDILVLYSKGLTSPLDITEYGFTHAEVTI